MTKSIEITEALYERLGRHARPFETPAQVIERILDQLEGAPTGGQKQPLPFSKPQATTPVSSAPGYTGKLQVNFYPSDPTAFKARLLREKEAWILMSYRDGQRELKNWSAKNFKETSDVLGNLRSGYLRGWRERGLVQADVAIEVSDLELNGEET